MSIRPFALSFLSFASALSAAAVPAPPSATVRVPNVTLASVPAPRVWTAERELKFTADVDFAIDLDLLAPLGDGKGNAATYLREFARDGNRAKAVESEIRSVRSPQESGSWSVLLPDHALLLEAEPWIDQSTCSFYPEVWAQQGIETGIMSHFHATILGRSWIVRGDGASDLASAMADYRRTIRLGRLLLQDDVWLGQDLTGRQLIAAGARAMYERAKVAGVAGTAAAALVVLSEYTWVRAVDATRMQRIDVFSTLEEPGLLSVIFGPTAHVGDAQFYAIAGMAKGAVNRRYRMEALARLFILKHTGAGDVDDRAEATLTALENDRDPLVAQTAVYYRNAKKPEITRAAVIR